MLFIPFLMSFIPIILRFVTKMTIIMEVVTNSVSFAENNKYILNCLIVEDDYAFALDTKIRSEELGLKVIAIASTFEEIDDALSKYSIDIILSDVKLSRNEYVYDYFNNIDNLPPLILFSGLDTMDVYEKSKASNPYIFLVKPFDDITLRSAVEGALKKDINSEKKREKKYRDGNVLNIKSSGKFISINTIQICFVKSEGNYCTIHFEGKKVAIRSSIGKVLEMISDSNFHQIHRSYIANFSKVNELIIGENLLLVGKDKLPIGRKFKKDVVELFKKEN